ncbi:MAG: Maf family protein [Pirellulaceae bacterium]|jgi:septum formation protein|nr:Maf family protein [Pirellulaceae bacterium]MDP7016608.1 Maf family protein [Pirellulaceae bacterium]
MSPSSLPPRLILASRSPRRRQLLEENGYDFEIDPASDTAECGVCTGETPPELVARLAYQKAADVFDRRRAAAQIAAGDIVIGCDTVAECQGRALGKPDDREHAAEMLNLLRGSKHHVYSGLCLMKIGADPSIRVECTKLVMEEISNADLEIYLNSYAWEGKAGGFGLQDRLGWIRIVHGSESNVVGLPLELLDKMLREL